MAACVFHALTGLPSVSVFSAAEKPAVTVVIDPGHGGEDGGAVSADGVEESHINLVLLRGTDSDDPGGRRDHLR